MQLDADGIQMLMALNNVLQQPDTPPSHGPLSVPNQRVTWDSLMLPPDFATVHQQHTVRPQRSGGRRRRAQEPAHDDMVHVPPPQGAGPVVLDSDVDLAHAAHSGPAVEPVDGAGNCLRVALNARALGALQLPDPLPFSELLSLSLIHI